jgi:hypothetical protein
VGSYVVSSAKRQSLSFASNLNISIMSKQKEKFLTIEEMREVQNAWAMIARKFETLNEERRVA